MPDPPRQPTAPSRNALIGLCQWLRPKLLWFWTAVVLVLVLNIATALFTTKSSDISGTPLGWILAHWPLVFAVGGLFLVLTWVVAYLGRPAFSPPQVFPALRDRQELIHRLSNEYHRQQAKSLQEATMKLLERQEPETTRLSPASLVSWRMNIPGKASLAAPTPIVQAYEQASVGLLILGDPGVGKSTLLLELALELLTRAEQDNEQPVPVLVNLSSWALNKLPLTTWLEEQLHSMIDIPPQLSQVWFEQNELLLLLDGLDEMDPSARTTCVASIEAYRNQAKHPVRLVVCSRRDEYLAQEEKLRQLDAIEVQRLMPEQVENYLKAGGKPLTAVRAALRRDAVLRDLVTTPLMLSVVLLAYRGKTDKDLPHLGTEKERQRQVLEHYVTRMLDPMEKPTRKWRYTPDSTQKWLTWLAWQMRQHNQSEFYVEYIRLNWLSSSYLDRLPQFLKKFFSSLPLVEKITPTIVKSERGREYVIPVVQLLDEKASLTPNQGIWRSARNGLHWLVFECFIIVVLVVNFLTQWLGENPLIEIFFVLLLGGGLYFSLIDGLGAFVDHFLVRFWLWRMGCLPWNLVAFLDEAADRLLLQRIGGGYRFIHPLFQEYFASLGSGTSASPQMQPSSSPQL